MIKTSIEKLAEEIGFDIGNSDDLTQAKLLNGFCRGLNNSMSDRQLDMQLCYIAEKLDNKSIKIIKMLIQYIELKEKNN